jgi:aspartyl-tRNA(Asn)/glutamyl-tRNA(Gln) amidotransferase subunit B
MSKATHSTRLRLLTPAPISSASLRWQNFRTASLRQQWNLPIHHARSLQTHSALADDVPFRKQLKDEAKRKNDAKRLEYNHGPSNSAEDNDKGFRKHRWKLTVGLEIHAQLNTERKLFSNAKSSESDEPNTNVALFDLAFPGSQQDFQIATMIPALRAATSLSCNVQRRSKFDRKHYYYQDQPAGYQITQYYEPFAKDGRVTLYDHDGIAPEDWTSVNIDIKQIQIEQDTAKSTLQAPSTSLLDFNRVGHPLIEIITHPQIHHPQTAAACVKKIQAILQTVNAVTTGMELGGLRADVNVSVSPMGSHTLGQRTEIKNLSSIKAVEDAIVAERDRQITVLEAGGSIDGETRGWKLGSTETTRLRGKEGEVDYRYMPDPDIPPLIIGNVSLFETNGILKAVNGSGIGPHQPHLQFNAPTAR